MPHHREIILVSMACGPLSEKGEKRMNTFTTKDGPTCQETRRIHHAQQGIRHLIGIPAKRRAGRYSPRVRRLPGATTPRQNRSSHTTPRTPDTKISSQLPELSQNHTVSSCPSIRP